MFLIICNTAVLEMILSVLKIEALKRKKKVAVVIEKAPIDPCHRTGILSQPSPSSSFE